MPFLSNWPLLDCHFHFWLPIFRHGPIPSSERTSVRSIMGSSGVEATQSNAQVYSSILLRYCWDGLLFVRQSNVNSPYGAKHMQFITSLVLAQAISPEMSYLGWMASALTTMSSAFIVVSAGSIFIGAYYLVTKKRPVTALASYLVLLPLPLLISICGWIYGSIASLAAIASSPELAITNQDIAGGLAASLLSILFAILVSLPTYVVLAYGLIARDFRSPSQGKTIAKPVEKAPPQSSMGVKPIPTVH